MDKAGTEAVRELLESVRDGSQRIGRAITTTLIAPKGIEEDATVVNVVDGLFAIARGLERIAGRQATGGGDDMKPLEAPLAVRVENLEKEIQAWRETERDRVTGLEKKIYALEQLLAKE
jgi:hypothetical protein